MAVGVLAGFQANSTLSGGLWIYKPDLALDPSGKEIVVNTNLLEYFETTADHTTVWLFYAQTNMGAAAPYQLHGAPAIAFMNDIENLFSGPILKKQFDLGSSYSGSPMDGLILLTFPFPVTVVFPANLTGSQGVAGIAATNGAVFILYKNGIPFGTMTFAAGETRAVFASAADITFGLTPQVLPAAPIADVLTVVGPTPADPTLGEIGFCLAGIVTSP